MASPEGAGYTPQWVVYRCYEDGGRLLYIGASKRLYRRLARHESTAWFQHVAFIRLEWFGSEEDAVEAEALAIVREHPVVNRQGVPRRPLPGQPAAVAWRSEGLAHPGHAVLGQLLDQAGQDGATPAQLLRMMREAGAAVSRETLQRWLSQEVRAGRATRPRPGRYRR